MKELNNNLTILVAEDDDDDFQLLQSAFQDVEIINPVRRVFNGEELLDYMYRRGRYENLKDNPYPFLLLLDLNMPRKSGYEALTEIRQDNRFAMLPIVIFSTSSAHQSIMECYQHGASSYIVKPNSYDALVQVSKSFKQYWLNTVEKVNATYNSDFSILS